MKKRKKIKQKAEAFDNIFEFIDREIETLSGRNLQLIKQRYYDELTLEGSGQ